MSINEKKERVSKGHVVVKNDTTEKSKEGKECGPAATVIREL